MKKKYLTVKQLSETYPCFSELSLRWILFHRDTNGASSFVLKVNSKIIIDVEKWELWLQKKNDEQNPQLEKKEENRSSIKSLFNNWFKKEK